MNKEAETYEELIRHKRCVDLTNDYGEYRYWTKTIDEYHPDKIIILDADGYCNPTSETVGVRPVIRVKVQVKGGGGGGGGAMSDTNLGMLAALNAYNRGGSEEQHQQPEGEQQHGGGGNDDEDGDDSAEENNGNNSSQ